MTLTLRPLSAIGGGNKAASGKGKTGGAGHASEVSASCLADQECGMRIPSHTDDQRSSGLDLDDEVVTFRCGPSYACRCQLPDRLMTSRGAGM
jgi:hypothetical protein